MDPLSDPLRTRPIQTGCEFTIELYQTGRFGFIDDADHQFGNGWLWIQTQNNSDGPEPLLTLGTFRMLRDLTSRTVKSWSYWDLCADQWETSREPETAVRLCGMLPEQPRLLLSSVADLVPYSHSSVSYITTRHFVLLYSVLLQSQDSLHHNMK